MNHAIEILKLHHTVDATQAKSYERRGEEIPDEIMERLRDYEQAIQSLYEMAS